MRLLSVFFLLGIPCLQAQTLATLRPVQLTYQFTHQFERANPDRAAIVRVALPVDAPGKQNIASLKFTPKPTRTIQQHERMYAEWVWASGKNPVVVQVDVQATLYPHGITTQPATAPEPLPEEIRKAYLAEEPFLGLRNPAVIALAQTIPENRTPAETIRHILNAVATSLRYGGYDTTDQGAAKALAAGKGDCTEYADLFVALCRLHGLPARSRMCILHRAKKIPLHTIAEVYLPKQGWVSVDPLDYDRNGKLKPVQVLYLSSLRNDLTLFGYFSDKAYMVYDLNEQGPFKTHVTIRNSRASKQTRSYTY